MSKFVIECPSCGKYAEASSGFLGLMATREIKCTCGYTIRIKSDKLSSKICDHCGNTVIFNWSKGEKALCPVCHERLNILEGRSSLVELTCPVCSCKVFANKNDEVCTCVLCNTTIDIRKQLEKEKVKKDGIANVIKYEGSNDVFVWKHPIEDFNLGSQLIVHESQEAIFFRDGKALDLFSSGRYTLATQNLPLLESLYKLPLNANEVFHSEIYFINMVTQMGIKWGTDSKVRLFDPGSGLYVELGACGTFNLRVANSRKLLLKLVGTTDGLSQNEILGSDGCKAGEVVGKFKSLIVSQVKANFARTIKEKQINVLELDSYLDVLAESLKNLINPALEEYGLVMPEFYITTIMTPDQDPNFQRLKLQFAEKTLRVREEEIRQKEAEAMQSRKIIEAQTEAQLKLVNAQSEAQALKIKAMAEAEAYRLQALAEAEEMKAKGYTYQQETARQVGLEALQNGITGGGSSASSSGSDSPLGAGTFHDIASLGITLGAMGGIINMTKDVLTPVFETSESIGSSVGNVISGKSGSWDCPCGAKNNTSRFCPECGARRPDSPPGNLWDCSCGAKNIASRFCPECGAKREDEMK